MPPPHPPAGVVPDPDRLVVQPRPRHAQERGEVGVDPQPRGDALLVGEAPGQYGGGGESGRVHDEAGLDPPVRDVPVQVVHAPRGDRDLVAVVRIAPQERAGVLVQLLRRDHAVAAHDVGLDLPRHHVGTAGQSGEPGSVSGRVERMAVADGAVEDRQQRAGELVHDVVAVAADREQSTGRPPDVRRVVGEDLRREDGADGQHALAGGPVGPQELPPGVLVGEIGAGQGSAEEELHPVGVHPPGMTYRDGRVKSPSRSATEGLPVGGQVTARVAARASAGVEPAGEPVGVAPFEFVEQALAQARDLAPGRAGGGLEQGEVAAPPGQAQLRGGQCLGCPAGRLFGSREDLGTLDGPGPWRGGPAVPSPQPVPRRQRGQEQQHEEHGSGGRPQQHCHAREHQACDEGGPAEAETGTPIGAAARCDVRVRRLLSPERGRDGADEHTHHSPSEHRRRTRHDTDRSQAEADCGSHGPGNSSDQHKDAPSPRVVSGDTPGSGA
jgi:hypothetical protein